MERSKMNYFVDIALALSFFSVFITGLMKFPGLLPFLAVSSTGFPLILISRIHDWSGITMASLVLIHLILHRKWIAAMTKQVFRIR